MLTCNTLIIKHIRCYMAIFGFFLNTTKKMKATQRIAFIL